MTWCTKSINQLYVIEIADVNEIELSQNGLEVARRGLLLVI